MAFGVMAAEFCVDLETLEKKEIALGFLGRFFHSANMTFVYWEITKGAVLPEHSHHHEQVVNLLSGNFELIVEGKRFELGPRALFAIPSNARHSGSAMTDCVILDTFYPIREDYRQGSAIGFKTG
jgi:quercetin dioxygenase-like cupin family protein